MIHPLLLNPILLFRYHSLMLSWILISIILPTSHHDWRPSLFEKLILLLRSSTRLVTIILWRWLHSWPSQRSTIRKGRFFLSLLLSLYFLLVSHLLLSLELFLPVLFLLHVLLVSLHFFLHVILLLLNVFIHSDLPVRSLIGWQPIWVSLRCLSMCASSLWALSFRGTSLRALSMVTSLWLSSSLLGWDIYLYLINFINFYLGGWRLLSLVGKLIIDIVLLALDILVLWGCSHFVPRYKASFFWLDIPQVAWQGFCQVLLVLFLFVHVLIYPAFSALSGWGGVLSSSWPFLRFWSCDVHHNFVVILNFSNWDVVGWVERVGVLICGLLKIIHLRLWIVSKR